jgi:hypothetical protein
MVRIMIVQVLLLVLNIMAIVRQIICLFEVPLVDFLYVVRCWVLCLIMLHCTFFYLGHCRGLKLHHWGREQFFDGSMVRAWLITAALGYNGKSTPIALSLLTRSRPLSIHIRMMLIRWQLLSNPFCWMKRCRWVLLLNNK